MSWLLIGCMAGVNNQSGVTVSSLTECLTSDWLHDRVNNQSEAMVSLLTEHLTPYLMQDRVTTNQGPWLAF